MMPAKLSFCKIELDTEVDLSPLDSDILVSVIWFRKKVIASATETNPGLNIRFEGPKM